MPERSVLDRVPEAARAVLANFVEDVLETLAGTVEGVVLFGSAAAGGFDPETSDLDLIVASAGDVDDATLAALRRMHGRLATTHPEWEDRLDVVYVPASGLRTFQERESPLVVISRGEPLHRTRTDPGWIMNWHAARERGIALLGPGPHELIAATSTQELVSAVRAHVRWMLAKVEACAAPELHAYAVVTACRALHTCSTGAQASKEAAARWAESRHPEWEEPIRQARTWRRGPADGAPDAKQIIPRSLDFVRFAVREMARTEAVHGTLGRW